MDDRKKNDYFIIYKMRFAKFIITANIINGLKFGITITNSTITTWKYNLKHGVIVEYQPDYIIQITLINYIYGIKHGLSRDYSHDKIQWIFPWVHGRQYGNIAMYYNGKLVSLNWIVNNKIQKTFFVN